MAFTSITAGQTDADSPVDQTLMDLIRTNLDDLDGRTITNGDAHDHDGGDGAPIDTGALAANAVTGDKINVTAASEGIQVVSANGNWTPPAGVYNIIEVTGAGGTLRLELYVSGSWKTSSNFVGGGSLYCDGTNMRFRETGGFNSATVTYQKF